MQQLASNSWRWPKFSPIEITNKQQQLFLWERGKRTVVLAAQSLQIQTEAEAEAEFLLLPADPSVQSSVQLLVLNTYLQLSCRRPVESISCHLVGSLEANRGEKSFSRWAREWLQRVEPFFLEWRAKS